MSETPDSPSSSDSPEPGPAPAPPAGSVAVATLTLPSPGVGLTRSGTYVPPPSYFATKWPGPESASGLAVPVAVLVGGLGFAVFIPLSRTGIGWFLGGLVAVLCTLVAVRSTRAAHPPADPGSTAYRVLWTVSSLALLSVLTFRNAWWLVTFCVLGALGCATLAIVGGRSIRSILFGLVAGPFAAFRGLPWVTRHVNSAGSPVRGNGGMRIIVSVGVTLVILLVFGALFASADAAFSQVLDDIVPEINAATVATWIFLFVVGLLTMTAAVFTIPAPPDLSGMDTPGTRRLGRVEWGIPITALVVLFAGFVAVQVTVLFGGERHVLETAKLTYAEYARGGFWQLVAVTILTLIVVTAVSRWAKQEAGLDRTLLRVLLGLLSVLSMVVVASALYRMYTYQQAYSFTGERVFVMGFELLLGTVFLLMLIAGIPWRGAWIPRTVVGLAVLLLLGLAVLNPEDYAARRNIQRYEETKAGCADRSDCTGKIDLWYLRALSADATPALTTLPPELRGCPLSWIVPKLEQPDPWYAWNLGRQQARQALTALGPGAAGTCSEADRFDFPKTD